MRARSLVPFLAVSFFGSIAGCKKADPATPAYHCDYPAGTEGTGDTCTEGWSAKQACDTGATPKPGACDRASAVGGCFFGGTPEKASATWYYPYVAGEGKAGMTLANVLTTCGSGLPLGPTGQAMWNDGGVPAGATADDPSLVLGTSADGLLPKGIAGLKADMSPADAAKVLRNADRVTPKGIADVAVVNTGGVVEYKLHFGTSNKLSQVEIVFDHALDKPEFAAKMFQAATAKWGKPSEGSGKPDETSWNLMKGGVFSVSLNDDGTALTYVLMLDSTFK
jgi:hypothetical protein